MVPGLQVDCQMSLAETPGVLLTVWVWEKVAVLLAVLAVVAWEEQPVLVVACNLKQMVLLVQLVVSELGPGKGQEMAD